MDSSDAMNKFIGKTIAKVNSEAVNYWIFYFTDGTSIAIEVEYLHSKSLYGIVPIEGFDLL